MSRFARIDKSTEIARIDRDPPLFPLRRGGLLRLSCGLVPLPQAFSQGLSLSFTALRRQRPGEEFETVTIAVPGQLAGKRCEFDSLVPFCSGGFGKLQEEPCSPEEPFGILRIDFKDRPHVGERFAESPGSREHPGQ